MVRIFVFHRITELSTEKHKMKFSMQEKDGMIIDLQRRYFIIFS